MTFAYIINSYVTNNLTLKKQDGRSGHEPIGLIFDMEGIGIRHVWKPGHYNVIVN